MYMYMYKSYRGLCLCLFLLPLPSQMSISTQYLLQLKQNRAWCWVNAVTCLGEPQVGLLKLDIRRTNEPDSGLVARKDMILSQKKTSIKNGNMSASIWCYGQLLGPASAHGGVHRRRVTEHKPVSCGAMNLESHPSPPLQSWKVVTLTKALVGAGKSCGSAETSGSQKECRGLVGNSCSSLAFVGKNLFLPHFPLRPCGLF